MGLGCESPCGASEGGWASAETAFLGRFCADLSVWNSSYNVEQDRKMYAVKRGLAEGTAPQPLRTSSASTPFASRGTSGTCSDQATLGPLGLPQPHQG